MSKYKMKPIIVEAEIYKLGMEDGFKCDLYKDDCYKEKCIITKNISSCRHKKPYINKIGDNCIVSEGDYIIIGVMGVKYNCKSDLFKMKFELVDE